MKYQFISDIEITCVLEEEELVKYNLNINEIIDIIENNKNPNELNYKLLNIVNVLNARIYHDYGKTFLSNDNDAGFSMKLRITNLNQLVLHIKKIAINPKDLENIPILDDEYPFDDIEEPNPLRNNSILAEIMEKLFHNMIEAEETKTTENFNEVPVDEIKQRKNQTKNTITHYVACFDTLNEVISFAQTISFNNTKSSLYKGNEKYVLIIENSNNQKENHQIEMFLSEFCNDFFTNLKKGKGYPSIAFIKEHYKNIIPNLAIDKLKQI